MASKVIRDMSASELLARWAEHLSIAGDDIYFLLKNRAKFRAVENMFRITPALQLPGDAVPEVYKWICRLWATEALMGIRRELDDQAGVINLLHVLYEMEQRSEVLTREAYLRATRRSLRELGEDADDEEALHDAFHDFETYGVIEKGEAHEHFLDPAAIRQDRIELQDKTRDAFRYAQLLIAHRTPMDQLEISDEQIDSAIDAIAECFDKYVALSEGDRPISLDGPVEEGWTEIFRVPWLAS